MVPPQALQWQKQVSLPELWLWPPEAGWLPDHTLGRQDSYHFASVPVRHEHFVR